LRRDWSPLVSLASLVVPLVLLGIAAKISRRPPVPQMTPSRVPHLLVLSLQPDHASLAGRAMPCPGDCFDEGYDLEALDASLAELKTLQPDKEQIVIVPDGRVPYVRLLEVLATVQPYYGLQSIQPE